MSARESDLLRLRSIVDCIDEILVTVRERTYYYLQRRDGAHVRSDYVRRVDAQRVAALVERRREVAAALREQDRTRRQIERALGGRPGHG